MAKIGTAENEVLLKDVEKNDEKGGVTVLPFNDEKAKKSFIFKVYSILMVQISVTSMIVYYMYKSNVARKITDDYPALFFIALFAMLILLFLMGILEKLRKQSPLNYLLMGIFTLGESFLLGIGCVQFRREEVIISLILCIIICFTLMIFACQTHIDFTVYGTYIMITMILLLIFGVMLFFYPSKLWTVLYSLIGVIVFSFCFVYDTQLMLNGKHKHTINEADYCFAALSLYLDIVNIFYYILLLFGFYKK